MKPHTPLTPSQLAVAVVLLAACSPSAPDNPTWAEDVAPILAANCVRCHTVPATGGAPDGFRLDTYDDWVADDGHVVRGASTMALWIAQRVSAETNPMPPRATLAGHRIEALENWAAALGADGRPTHGGPRPGNAPPEMTLLGTEEVDGVLVIDYEIRDPDRDIVVGELRAGDAVITRELHSGRGQAVWDTGAAAEGSYPISAVLDDGSDRHTLELATYEVSHPDNTAPTVRILSPARDAIVASKQAEVFDINVDIADPDGDPLTMTVQAQLGTDTVDIVTDAPADPGTNTVSWNVVEVPQGLSWRVLVTVSDQTTTRTAESGPFIISHWATTETFESIGDVLVNCTYCHPGDNTVPGVTHDFTRYQGDGDVLGVYELRGLIYRRVVQQRTMPPMSTGVVLPDAALDRLGYWLLAGAPQ